MQNWLGARVAALHHRTFTRALRRTLVVIFPFVLVGAVSQWLQDSLLNPSGFLYGVLALDAWTTPGVMQVLSSNLMALRAVTLGMVGLAAAFAMAKYTARSYQRDEQMAGLTALSAYLLLALRHGNNGRFNLDWMLTSYGTLLLALLVGYLVGRAFRRWGQPAHLAREAALSEIFHRMFAALRPILIVLTISLVWQALLNLASYYSLLSQFYGSLQGIGNGNQPVWLKFAVICLTNILAWGGLNGPYYNGQLDLDGSQVAADLNYLLTHHGQGDLPYPYLASVLQKAFANFGGPGLTLALLIALILATNQRDYHRLVRANLVPVLFNSDYGLAVGLPVLLNPLYLIPFLGLPLLNLAVASGLLALHLFPTPVYPVPTGTPGILYAFFGTNGNWWALLTSLVLLAVDVVGYLPFVKLALRLNDQLPATDQGRENG